MCQKGVSQLHFGPCLYFTKRKHDRKVAEKKINTKADTSTGMAELQLGYEDWMRQARQIIVRASWSNKAQGNGEATVTLRP